MTHNKIEQTDSSIEGAENIIERPSDAYFLRNNASAKIPRASVVYGGATKLNNGSIQSNYMSIVENSESIFDFNANLAIYDTIRTQNAQQEETNHDSNDFRSNSAMIKNQSNKSFVVSDNFKLRNFRHGLGSRNYFTNNSSDQENFDPRASYKSVNSENSMSFGPKAVTKVSLTFQN